MQKKIVISGFADEISPSLDEQLRVLGELGIKYLSLRAADGKGVAEYSAAEVKETLLPRLNAAGVGVSSLGSPIGKVPVNDEAAFEQQLAQLEELCKICEVLHCRYIRMFSFYIPKGDDPDAWREVVLRKLRAFAEVAGRYGVVLIHENEKEIYGDTGARCKVILDALASPWFKAAFDFANFVQCGEDPALCWELLKEHVVYIHIKDAMYGKGENVLCGTGDGKIAQLLAEAILKDGYEGFLTLEPHLVLFDTLQSLETANASEVIAENKAKDGAEGYAMQYRALQGILEKIL